MEGEGCPWPAEHWSSSHRARSESYEPQRARYAAAPAQTAGVAIPKALKMVGTLESTGEKPIVICTDSQAAIVLLASGVGAKLRGR